VDGLLFKAHFINRLPADMRDQVAIQFELLTSRELAKLADTVWTARNSKKNGKLVAAALPSSAEEDDSKEELVAAAFCPQKGKGVTQAKGGQKLIPRRKPAAQQDR